MFPSIPWSNVTFQFYSARRCEMGFSENHDNAIFILSALGLVELPGAIVFYISLSPLQNDNDANISSSIAVIRALNIHFLLNNEFNQSSTVSHDYNVIPYLVIFTTEHSYFVNIGQKQFICEFSFLQK